MKILLLSDSHRCISHMVQAVEESQPDMIFHMGDHLADGQKLQMQYRQIPLYTVPGNCDFVDWDTPNTAVHTVGGVTIMRTHGHDFGVKRGLHELALAARKREADVVLFGHTHRAVVEQQDGLWIINPGTCSAGNCWSYGILTLNSGEIHCEIVQKED